MNTLLREFANDDTVRLISALVLVDIVLGISAAVKIGTFQFNYLMDFLRNDVLGKLIPYFAVWGAVRLGGDLTIGGFGAIEEVLGAGIVVALGASILNSIRDLKLESQPLNTTNMVAGPDPNARL